MSKRSSIAGRVCAAVLFAASASPAQAFVEMNLSGPAQPASPVPTTVVAAQTTLPQAASAGYLGYLSALLVYSSAYMTAASAATPAASASNAGQPNPYKADSTTVPGGVQPTFSYDSDSTAPTGQPGVSYYSNSTDPRGGRRSGVSYFSDSTNPFRAAFTPRSEPSATVAPAWPSSVAPDPSAAEQARPTAAPEPQSSAAATTPAVAIPPPAESAESAEPAPVSIPEDAGSSEAPQTELLASSTRVQTTDADDSPTDAGSAPALFDFGWLRTFVGTMVSGAFYYGAIGCVLTAATICALVLALRTRRGRARG